MLYFAPDNPDLNPPLREEGHEVEEGVRSEEKSGRSREINGESSASRRSIFKTKQRVRRESRSNIITTG